MTADVLPADVDPRVVRRKVAWRILPLVFVLYIIAYLDRANAAFAQEDMSADLQFTKANFGWGIALFFVGYQLLEIPGALLVERWSARKWFARILFTWGLCSMGMALVKTPGQFYFARFLLGIAEAGFFPGIIVYFTHWFPRAQRGRAMAGLVFGIPVSLALGAQVSGLLLKVDWFGIAGWQWMFIIEGIPAVIMGIAVPFLLTDRPNQAKWLTPAERAWLEQTLEAERQEAAARGSVTFLQALRSPTVWLLALGILATNIGGYAMLAWMPVAMKALLKATADATATISSTDVLMWMSLMYTCGLAGVVVSGLSSDWTGDRKWHCVTGQVMTGVCLAGALAPGLPWAGVIACMCGVGFFAYSWPSPFWVLPTLTLSASAAAVSIGFINMSANFAGAIGPPAVGEMQDAGLDIKTCLLFPVGCFVLGGVIVSLIRIPPPAAIHKNDTRIQVLESR